MSIKVMQPAGLRTAVRPQKLGDFFQQAKRKGKPGLPTLSVTIDRGIVRRGLLDRKVESELSPEDHLLVQPGDLAYNMMRMWQGAMGVACEAGLVSPAYVVCSPRVGADSRYLFYLLKSPRMIKRLHDYSCGLTGDRLRLYFQDFAAVPAVVPRIETQERIASILSAWDSVNECLASLVEAKRVLYKGLSSKLLTGKLRFKEFGKPAQGSTPPTGWKYSKLGELVSINERTLPENTDPLYEFYYLELSDVDRGLVNLPEERVSFQKSPSRARRQVKSGDILMSTVRPNLEGFGRYLGKLNNVVASTGFAVLSDAGLSDMCFVYHLLHSPGVQRQLLGLVLGSGYPAVSASDVRLLKVPTPCLDEQTRIGRVLDCLQREIFLCEALYNASKSQQKGLIQKLMTERSA